MSKSIRFPLVASTRRRALWDTDTSQRFKNDYHEFQSTFAIRKKTCSSLLSSPDRRPHGEHLNSIIPHLVDDLEVFCSAGTPSLNIEESNIMILVKLSCRTCDLLFGDVFAPDYSGSFR